MAQRRVVITGIGTATALGIGREKYWAAVRNNECGVRRITGFDPGGFPCQVGGEVQGLEVRDVVPKAHRKATKLMSRDIALAVAAAEAAVRDASLKTKSTAPDEAPDVDPTRCGVNIGAGLICCDLAELAGAVEKAVVDGEFSYERWGRDGMESLTPLWLLKYLPNMLGCHVSIIHDLQGPNNNLTCSEVSGLLSAGEAYRIIQRGEADLMVAGGAECKVNPMGLLRQSLAGRATTSGNDDPAGACKPFDERADGTVVAEGAGIVILEELETARARKARIYGEVLGFGASNCLVDVGGNGESRGITLAIRKALGEAAIAPGELDLVMARGTAVPGDDRLEVAGIAMALGDAAGKVPVTAVTSRVGNCGAGAGIVDYVSAVLAMHDGWIPPLHNCREPRREFGLDFVIGQGREARIENVLTSGFTYGGQTAALVTRKWDQD